LTDAENQNSNGEETFAALFGATANDQKTIREGEVVSGRILRISKDFVLVDIGFKSEGLIPIHEFQDGSGKVAIEKDEEINVFVESYENEDGTVILSKEKADKAKLWDEVAIACEKGELVEGKIISKVKGGLSVDIGIKAFLPGSQIDLAPVRNMDGMINKVYQFKIIKFNQKRGNIVLSRRVLLEQERDQLRSKTLEVLEEGKVMKGIVKNITDYGAFVDLGGIDGLLHITDMSWKRINHPGELVHIGDEIDVKILKYDNERQRVSLGLKQITEDPWTGVQDRYSIDTRIKGKIVSITDYGAFMEIEEGVEGLIHISEMSWTKRIKHPSQLLNVEDEVEAVVLDVDFDNRKIALGLKQVDPNPWAILAERYPEGTRIKGTVKNVTDFGIFVGIDDGIDGLIHVSDISWSQKIKDPAELYEKGSEVETVVLNIDPENERFSLGIKQLTPNPWQEAANRYPAGTIIEGEVIKITDFGIFVRLEDEIEGLVHVSEIAEERVENPNDYAEVGKVVKATVLNVDPHEKRISLSLRELKRAEEKREYETYGKSGSTNSSTFGDLMPESLKTTPSTTNAEAEPETVEAEAATVEAESDDGDVSVTNSTTDSESTARDGS
jgi:small subunit ribosomal protein S1